MFQPNGLHDGVRQQATGWEGSPYGTENTPLVTCGGLADRNQKYFNIGQPGGAAATLTVPLACHHVVGWDIIWGFWNKMITQKEYLTARSYLALFGAAQGTTSDLENQIKNKKFRDGGTWGAKMCWHPNNIVRGPEHRSDDPNVNTAPEDRIDFQKARADIYKGRVRGLIAAGQNMCEYLRFGQVEAAKKAIAYFRQIRNEEMMEWDESIWAVDSLYPGYSSVRDVAKGGFNITRPKWRVHISKH